MNSGVGRRMAFERRAADRHEGHDERVDAERDQPLADREDGLRACRRGRRGCRCGPGRGRTRRPPPRRRPCSARPARSALPGMILRRSSGVTTSRCMPSVSMPARLHALEPAVVVGRLALRLDRQIDGGLDRRTRSRTGWPRRDRGRGGVPVVITMCFTPSSSTAARATSASCSGVLRAMVRPAASDWPIAQNWQVLRAALVADAGLQHRRREHVAAVQRRDVRIRHAVEGLQRVEARLLREADARRSGWPSRRMRLRARGVGRLGDEGRVEGRRGVHRHHDRARRRSSPPCGRTGRRRRGGWRRRRSGQPAERRSDCNSVISVPARTGSWRDLLRRMKRRRRASRCESGAAGR